MLNDPIRIASGVAVYSSIIITVCTWCICGKARLRRGLIHRFDSNHNKATYYAVADSTRVLRQHSAKEQKERFATDHPRYGTAAVSCPRQDHYYDTIPSRVLSLLADRAD